MQAIKVGRAEYAGPGRAGPGGSEECQHPPQVAELVVILDGVEARPLGCLPAQADTVGLSQTNADQEGLPEALGNLLELRDRGA